MKTTVLIPKQASISLDLDNQWAYMKTHGDQGWQDYPSYFDAVIPHILEILDRLKIKITFFVTGKDAKAERHHPLFHEILRQNHEIANHSFSHDPLFHLYDKEQIKKEILDADHAIAQATGVRPTGFRSPGFSWNTMIPQVLCDNGYSYDASIFPCVWGPLLRRYYFATASLSHAEKKKLYGLYGRFEDAFRSGKPFFHELADGQSLLEIPVTTMPFLKLPVHMTYLMYLASRSENAMLFYLKLSLRLYAITGLQPSFVLHPLDLIGNDLLPEMRYFPGMSLASSSKAEIFEKILHRMKNRFTFAPLQDCAAGFISIRKSA